MTVKSNVESRRPDKAAPFFSKTFDLGVVIFPCAALASSIHLRGRMFGRLLWWRRKNDGFEWREYVRTTILVRRAKREQKLDDAREAVVARVKDAARQGAAASAAGARAAGEHVARGGKAAAGFVGSAIAIGAMSIWRACLSGARNAATLIADHAPGLASVAERLERGAAGARERLSNLRTPNRLRMPQITASGVITTASVAIIALLLGWVYPGAITANRSMPDAQEKRIETASIAKPSTAIATSGDTVTGRARVLSGDTLRVGETSIKLDGIEAPVRQQDCTKLDGRRWSCGSAAIEGLKRLVQGRQVACEISTSEPGQPAHATCRAGDRDIAAELVRRGHVFPETGLFARYTAEESEARAASAGLWQGEADRPADFRSKLWDEAKRASPDGCPIKGVITGEGKVYTLPWSSDYARRKVRTVKGERWFCSEDEARAAGWQPSDRS